MTRARATLEPSTPRVPATRLPSTRRVLATAAALSLAACGRPVAPDGAGSSGGEAPITIAAIVAQRAHREPPASAVSAEGRYLATASRYALAITDVETGITRSVLPHDLGPDTYASAVAWAPDGRGIAVLSAYNGLFGDVTWRGLDTDFEMRVSEVSGAAGILLVPGPMLLSVPEASASTLEGRRPDDREPSWTVALPGLSGIIAQLVGSDDGTLVAIGTDADQVVLVDVASATVVASDPVLPERDEDCGEDCSDEDDVPVRELDADTVAYPLWVGPSGLVAWRADHRLTITTRAGTRELATECEDVLRGEGFLDVTCGDAPLRVDLAAMSVAPRPADDTAERQVARIRTILDELDAAGEHSLWQVSGSLAAGLTTSFRSFEVRWSAEGVEHTETEERYARPYDAGDERSCEVYADDVVFVSIQGEEVELAGATSLEASSYELDIDCQSITWSRPDGVTIWTLSGMTADPLTYPAGSEPIVARDGLLVVRNGATNAYEVRDGSRTAGPFAAPPAGCEFRYVSEEEDTSVVAVRVATGLLVVDADAWSESEEEDEEDGDENGGERARRGPYVIPLPSDACTLTVLDDGRLFAATPTVVSLLDLATGATRATYPRPGHASVRQGRLLDCTEGMRLYDLETGAALGAVPGPCSGAEIVGDLVVHRDPAGGRGRVHVARPSDGAGLTLIVLEGDNPAVAAISDEGVIWTDDEDDVTAFALALSDGGVFTRTMIHGAAMRARYRSTLLADFFEGRPLPAGPPLSPAR